MNVDGPGVLKERRVLKVGYDIYIGEAETIDGEIRIERAIQDAAPEFGFGDISGRGNSRHPGYSQMTEFCKATGLYELFFGKNSGLLRTHPGCCPIGQEHLESIREAKEKWEEGHPNCKELLPTKDKEPALNRNDEREGNQYDWFYARLIWYEFWFEWALMNCRKPTIANS